MLKIQKEEYENIQTRTRTASFITMLRSYHSPHNKTVEDDPR